MLKRIKDKDFKVVAEKLWDPNSDVEKIVSMMEKWGQIELQVRIYVVSSIKSDEKPFFAGTRDAILALGGKKWLEDHSDPAKE